jgi:hypothetical protein
MWLRTQHDIIFLHSCCSETLKFLYHSYRHSPKTHYYLHYIWITTSENIIRNLAVLDSAARHEGILRTGGIAPGTLNIRRRRSVSFSLEKHTPYPLYTRLDGHQTQPVRLGNEKNLLPLSGIEPRSVDRSAYCVVTTIWIKNETDTWRARRNEIYTTILSRNFERLYCGMASAGSNWNQWPTFRIPVQ